VIVVYLGFYEVGWGGGAEGAIFEAPKAL